MFQENCYYKYKGGSTNKELIEGLVYKCATTTSQFSYSILEVRTTNITKRVCVSNSDIKYFNKSGVQDYNVAKNNTKVLESYYITPHPDLKKPYVAYPNDIPEDETITFNNITKENLPTTKSDNITDPYHYNRGKISPIEYIEANNLGFEEGNVVKYITRHKYKNGKEDIIKAIKYCEFILKYQYND